MTPFTLFIVSLEKDGGEVGTHQTPATFTYAAKSFDGRELGRNLSPQIARSYGSVRPSIRGSGYFDADGTFILLDAHEVPATAACC